MSANNMDVKGGAAAGFDSQGRKTKVRLMRTVSVGKKLGSIAATLLFPLVLLLFLFSHNMYSTISFTAKEQAGLAVVNPLPDLAGAIADHGTATAETVLGVKEADATAKKLEADAAGAIQKVDALMAGYDNAAAVASWKNIRTQWDAVKGAAYKSTTEVLDAHRKLTGAIYDLRDAVVMESNLALDPEAGSYYAIDVSTGKVPDVTRFLGEARATAISVQASGTINAEQRRALIAQAGVIQDRLDAVKGELSAARDAFKDRPETLARTNAIAADWDAGVTTWLGELNKLALAPTVTADNVKELLQHTAGLSAQIATTQDLSTVAAASALNVRNSHDRMMMWITVSVSVLAVLLSIWLVAAISRRIAGAIIRLRNISANVSKGIYNNVIDPRGTDELSALFDAVNTMQLQLQKEAENRAIAETEIMRLRRALDAAATNVMVADTGNNIIYMNQSVSKFFKDREMDLRKDLTGFDASKLLGSNIDQFHRTPSHQRNLLAGLRTTHRGEMVVGGLTIVVVANPIFDDAGVRVGTVVEWTDRTMEVSANKEVAELVSAVNGGNLSVRIVEEGKTGFYKVIAAGLNELVANVNDVVQAVHSLVQSANAGDMSARMAFEGKPGLNRTLGEGVNQLVDEVSNVVEEMQKVVASANAGDLTKRMPVEGRSGLFTKVGTGVNELTANMASVISQVKEAASEVHRGADEISQGNTNLSQRTEEQASSLEETASSMEEMTSTVKQNADNAGQANQLAVAARDQAEKGGAVVARAVRAMTDINDASKKIADIIGVIDEIAFQTNLLALNAAVEAARAGEQGRGFAVVATEVRNLAGRSATAAKEIKGLIQDSVRKVDEGSSLVTQSGVTLEQIVAAVKKVTDIVAEIAAASQEQSSGIEQVNKAVMQLDELTQQNAALVEEASAASQSMADQARSLNETMARYAVAEGVAARASAGARAISAGAVPAKAAAPRPAASRPYAVKASPTAVKRVREQSAAPLEATGTDDAVWKEF